MNSNRLLYPEDELSTGNYRSRVSLGEDGSEEEKPPKKRRTASKPAPMAAPRYCRDRGSAFSPPFDICFYFSDIYVILPVLPRGQTQRQTSAATTATEVAVIHSSQEDQRRTRAQKVRVEPLVSGCIFPVPRIRIQHFSSMWSRIQAFYNKRT